MSGLCVWRVTDQCECGKSGKEVEFWSCRRRFRNSNRCRGLYKNGPIRQWNNSAWWNVYTCTIGCRRRHQDQHEDTWWRRQIRAGRHFGDRGEELLAWYYSYGYEQESSHNIRGRSRKKQCIFKKNGTGAGKSTKAGSRGCIYRKLCGHGCEWWKRSYGTRGNHGRIYRNPCRRYCKRRVCGSYGCCAIYRAGMHL